MKTPLRLLMLGVVLSAVPVAAVEILHVPGDVASIQVAIDQISDGGVIEIAPGSYPAPAGGFRANNIGKSFTIRSAGGAVILDGQSSTHVFEYLNTSPDMGGPITFRGITFYHGLSVTNGAAGGITLGRARATFVECVFQENGSDATNTGGGGAAVFNDSWALFTDCLWLDNWARNEGGGLRVGEDSVAYVHSSQFVGNAVNLPAHRTTAAGGGVHIGNSDVRVTNTRFDGNEAGYAGGGLLAIGNWQDPVSIPRSHVLVANCTFVDNRAEPDPSVTSPAPTEAGAVHAENQTIVRIFNSRFLTNSAEKGGAVNTYRGNIEVEDSLFQGNRATGVGIGTGWGGALAVISNDTTIDGSINRPSGQMTVRNSLVQGRYGAVGTVGQAAGGLFASGDNNRRYGLAGVSPTASASATRATVVVDGVVFADCDVLQTAGVGASGAGGGIAAFLADLNMSGSLFIDSDAIASGGSPSSNGGGARIVIESLAAVTDTMFAGNTADTFGGAVFTQGSEIHFFGCDFVENDLTGSPTFGWALFAGPLENTYGMDMDASGAVSGCVLSRNNGLPVFDDDRDNGPINDIRYNGNQFFRSGSSQIYQSPLVGAKTVSELNSLVITRTGGRNTDKSQADNSAPGSAPIVGSILAVPPRILPTLAAGDSGSQSQSFVAYAWSGGSATVDGQPVAGNTGLASAGVGTHTLDVVGQQYTSSISMAPLPSATFSADPVAISSGQFSTLSWVVTAGTFLDVAIDQGVMTTPAASGAVVVSPRATTTYRLAVVTEEGGVVKEVTVYVDETPAEEVFDDGFESSDTSFWSTTVGG